MWRTARVRLDMEVEEEQGARDDRALVEAAREGNSDAFGELVRRHRARAHGWASRLTRDGHLAEDIVQEALIRAFLQLGQLVDSRRFGPWLKTIVRNEAYMKLRRGGPYGKERPFSGLLPVHEEREPGGRLDDLLARLCQKGDAERGDASLNPAEILASREVFETFREWIRCLTEKERGIFEAFFSGSCRRTRLRCSSEQQRAVSTTICRERVRRYARSEYASVFEGT